MLFLKISWEGIKVIANGLGANNLVDSIDARLQVLGNTKGVTFEDVKAVAELIGCEQPLAQLEQMIANQIQLYRIIHSETLSNATKIRILTTMGLARNEIANLLKIRYQQVRNTLLRSAAAAS